MSSVAHGWPDGEARPMPFGQLLASGNNVTVGGSGVLDLGELELAAWPCVAIAIAAGRQVQVDIDWNYVGDALVQPHQTLYHDGLDSARTIPCLGQRAVGFTFAAPPGTIITYAVLGSNRPADSANGIGVMRSFAVADPGAGVGVVPLYEVPLGTTAILHGVDFLLTTGAAPGAGSAWVEHLDPAGRQLALSELNAGGLAAGSVARVTGNSHQGGTGGSSSIAGLPETEWTTERVLPLYRMPYLYAAQLRYNGIAADDALSGIVVTVEEIV